MNSQIYINSEEINKTLSLLKKIQSDLETFINDQQTINEELHKQWSGTSGDKSYDRIKKHEKRYETFLKETKKRINFLEIVNYLYFELDNKINKRLEENIETEM